MSQVLKWMEEKDYEQLVFNYDKTSGLKAIICIHDTTLGPALGGTRMLQYDTEKEAIKDVMRLAEGMTYKAAAAGLNLGGGKAVIIGDASQDKSEELWRAFGRYVQSLQGRYITAVDVNTSVDDMAFVNQETDHVVGLPSISGDPSPVTAFGVVQAMKASAEEVYGSTDLSGKTVAVQGVGSVGYYLCQNLFEAGAELVVTDIDDDKVKKVQEEFQAEAVDPDEIYSVDCDIFSPSALGGVINDETIPELRCDIVCGGANNILAEDRHGDILDDKDIIYAPDYVSNAGGLINVYHELKGYDREEALDTAAGIYDRMRKIFRISSRDNIPTHKAADIMAEERIERIKNVRCNHITR